MKKVIEQSAKDRFTEDIINAMDMTVLDMLNSKDDADVLRLRGNLSALSEAYKAVEENANKEKEVRATNKAANMNMITGFGTTFLSVASTIGLTLSTFAFETSGEGSFFTTAGRAAIANALKRIK